MDDRRRGDRGTGLFFVGGVVSVVLSPCHMASIPLIVSYVAGQEKGLYAKGAAFYAAAFTIGLREMPSGSFIKLPDGGLA
jgi:cytochrome c biogenesis protein CcdA